MRNTHLSALVTIGILVMALSAVLIDNSPPLAVASVEAIRVPDITTTTAEAPSTTNSGSSTSLIPDVDALGRPVADLHATTTTTSTTTTTTTAPLAAASSPTTAPPTTQPKKADPEPKPDPGGSSPKSESKFAASINSYRESKGLAGLTRNGSLDSEARAWAKHLAEAGKLSHSSLGRLLPPWSAAAENVGTGGSVKSLFNALVDSSGHRTNMLGDYTNFGIGVWIDGDGRLWTAHLFAR
jgi:uncharacterized protein YkwD